MLVFLIRNIGGNIILCSWGRHQKDFRSFWGFAKVHFTAVLIGQFFSFGCCTCTCCLQWFESRYSFKLHSTKAELELSWRCLLRFWNSSKKTLNVLCKDSWETVKKNGQMALEHLMPLKCSRQRDPTVENGWVGWGLAGVNLMQWK